MLVIENFYSVTYMYLTLISNFKGSNDKIGIIFSKEIY